MCITYLEIQLVWYFRTVPYASTRWPHLNNVPFRIYACGLGIRFDGSFVLNAKDVSCIGTKRTAVLALE